MSIEIKNSKTTNPTPYTTCLENTASIKDSLVNLNNVEFDKEAANIAVKHELDVVVVRAIGKGAISPDLSINKSSQFIKGYLNLKNSLLSEEQKIQGLLEHFCVNKKMIEQIIKGETVSEEDINVWREEIEKKSAPLTDEDKEFIREFIAAAETEEEDSARIIECSKDFGVSRNVIGSITAWKTSKDGEKVLTKELIEETPKRVFETIEEEIQDRVARAYAKGGQALADKEKDQLEKEITSKTRTQINSIAAWLKIKPNERVPEDILPKFLEQLEKEKSAKKLGKTAKNKKKLQKKGVENDKLTDSKELVKNEVNGVHFEYDNEIKNKWREKLAEFVNEQTDEIERKNMKVICLSGIKMQEAKVYIDLGFNAENIVCVERGRTKKSEKREDLEEFEKNGKDLGVKTYFGEMVDYLDENDEVFDVVSIDSIGCFSKSSVNILNKMKTSKKFLLLLNFMAKREWATQDKIKGFTYWVSPEITDNCSSKPGLESLVKTREYMENSDEVPINIAREDGLVKYVDSILNSKKFDSELWTMLEKKLSKVPFFKDEDIQMFSDNEEAFGYLQSVLVGVADTISKHLAKLFGEDFSIPLSNMVIQTMFKTNLLTKIDQFSYKNLKGSPYFSEFCVFENKDSDVIKMKQSAKEVLKIVLEIMASFNDGVEKEKVIYPTPYITDKKGRALPHISLPIKEERIVFFKKGKSIAKIRIKQLFQDISRYLDISEQNLFVKLMSGTEKIPIREEIK